MNTKAKQMMDKWNRRAERNYKIAEEYRLSWKETGDYDYRDMHLEYYYRGQICGEAAADFEELM